MKTYPKEKIIGNYKVKAIAGCRVKPEKWPYARLLMPSDWENASHYLQRGWGEHEGKIAVNVYITGRSIRYSFLHGHHVSILLEFVGDCEPSTYTYGILELDAGTESMQKIEEIAQIG